MRASDLIRRIFEEAWSRGDFSVLDEVESDEIVFHYNGSTMTTDIESLPFLVGQWRTAFPDLELTVRHVVEQDDIVAVSLTLTGTHRGDWWAIPPTDRAVSAEEMMFFRFEDGALVEMWEVFDELGLRNQLAD